MLLSFGLTKIPIKITKVKNVYLSFITCLSYFGEWKSGYTCLFDLCDYGQVQFTAAISACLPFKRTFKQDLFISIMD